MKTRNELKKEQKARARRWEASHAAAAQRADRADQVMNTPNGYQAIERRLGFGYIGTFPTEGQARAALAICTRL
jgi:hypothetical protein